MQSNKVIDKAKFSRELEEALVKMLHQKELITINEMKEVLRRIGEKYNSKPVLTGE